MSNVVLAGLILGLHGFWIYKLARYDWSKFEQDSRGDDFLRPLE